MINDYFLNFLFVVLQKRLKLKLLFVYLQISSFSSSPKVEHV